MRGFSAPAADSARAGPRGGRSGGGDRRGTARALEGTALPRVGSSAHVPSDASDEPLEQEQTDVDAESIRCRRVGADRGRAGGACAGGRVPRAGASGGG